ncbi:MAG: PPC domain-containing protein [Phormidesmis sp.]
MQALLKLGAIVFTAGLLLVTEGALRQPAAKAETLIEEAGALSSGDAVLDDGSLYDQYTFSASDGQYVTISLESEDFDPYLILLDPTGQRIGENDDVSSTNRNSRLIVTLPSTGLYTAVANSYESGRSGEYAITIDLVNNRSSLTQILAVSAVPGSTAACSDAVVAMTRTIESGREVTAWVSSLQLNRLYRSVPELRPQGVTVSIAGSAAPSVLLSSQLLNQLSARVIADCASVGAVVFDVETAGSVRTFGMMPASSSNARTVTGAAAGALVKEFDCSDATARALLSWGEQVCS